MTLVGYARVSTASQDATAQQTALTTAGCSRVYTDRSSGSRGDRPELAAALEYLRPGDTLVVWRLDRLGRSLPHLLDMLAQLQARQVHFASLTEHIDTSTPQGQLLYALLGAFAQFERALIRERTTAGLAAARAAGRLGGRPHALKPAEVRYVKRQYEAHVPIAELARQLSVAPTTIYRTLRRVA